MYVNILHRTAGGVLATGTGYDIYLKQQDLAHRLGLKTTMLIHYHDLFDNKVLDDVRRDAEQHGDEIGLALHKLDGPGLTELSHGLRSIWLFPAERKRQILETIFGRYRDVFGSGPASLASYHLDASTVEILRQVSPETRTVVGGCFEEGVRVFHGCNRSWYLFNEGMPIGPWYPSKSHTLRPARSADDAAGVVAVPHLSRDMSLSYEGRNDFWASHPPNVMRGMGNDGSFCPYDLNLIDQYRMQARYNDGLAYFNIFVNVGWLMPNRNLEYPPEVAWELYTKQLTYLAELQGRGESEAMTMERFGDWFRKHRPLERSVADVYWAREMLYGSGKHYVWFCDPQKRLLFDATQGGSIGDLRAYVGQVPVSTGPDSPAMAVGSYPYMIQSQHRTGFANHYADGSRTTLRLRHKGEMVDLAACPTRCRSVERQADGGVAVAFSPAVATFSDGTRCEVTTTFSMPPSGDVRIDRRIACTPAGCQLEAEEYVKGCFGATEYPEPLHDVVLSVRSSKRQAMGYGYLGRRIEADGATSVAADVPPVRTRIALEPADGKAARGWAAEGHLFDPYYTLALVYEVGDDAALSTWLRLEPVEADAGEQAESPESAKYVPAVQAAAPSPGGRNPHLETMRCPVCFSRENDVVLLREGPEMYYCVHCGFRGTPGEVHGMYKDCQKKYHWMTRRLTVEDQLAM